MLPTHGAGPDRGPSAPWPTLAACTGLLDGTGAAGLEELVNQAQALHAELGTIASRLADGAAAINQLAENVSEVTDPALHADDELLSNALRQQSQALEAAELAAASTPGPGPGPGPGPRPTHATQRGAPSHTTAGAVEGAAAERSTSTLATAMSDVHRVFCRLAEQLQTQSARVRAGLRTVMEAQLRIRQLREGHSNHRYLELRGEAEAVCRRIESMAPAPTAYVHAVQEALRRRVFTERYTELSAAAATQLSQLRADEIEERERYKHEHGRFIAGWDALLGLDDYPMVRAWSRVRGPDGIGI